MAQSRSRYSLSRIDPFSLCAIIPALALAGLCGVSGFMPGAIAMAFLAVVIVAVEVWIHRRDPASPPPRRARTAQQQAARPQPPRQQFPRQQPPVRRQPPPPPRRNPAAAQPPPRRQPPRPRVR